MHPKTSTLSFLACTVIVVSGCAATAATNGHPVSGMGTTAGVSDQRPSPAARMTCGPEIHGDVATIVAPQHVPAGTATWVDGLYTCTYRLASGPLVLSVKDSSSAASALAYFRSTRPQTGTTRSLHGLAALGLPAYESSRGTVTFLKDSSTLVVDATRVARDAGSHYTSRTDLAYEVASDVIGCWSED